MITYQTLAGVSLESIHRCFLSAFSDYQVKVRLPLEALRTMLRRRGFAPELSVGAVASGELVGLVLNGRREWNGRDTLHDTGTGVVPDYRRKGITTGMFSHVLDLCQRAGIQQYLLEVIQTNTPAVELYQRSGFVTVRSFECFRGPRNAVSGSPDVKTEAVPVSRLDWDSLRGFWDFQPSWQNSVDSIMALPDELVGVVASDAGRVVGYGVIERRTGDIPQLAVDKRFRGRGFGRGILRELARCSDAAEMRVLNVEVGQTGVVEFLERNGFRSFVRQYEMVMAV